MQPTDLTGSAPVHGSRSGETDKQVGVAPPSNKGQFTTISVRYVSRASWPPSCNVSEAMGAAPKTDAGSLGSRVDDGWSLGEESTHFTLRSVPVSPSVVVASEEEEGWSLAKESHDTVPAIKLNSTILNPLTEEELEAFSRAELAMGTEVDFPIADDAWFQELRCIVPPKRAPSVTEMAVQVPLAKEHQEEPLPVTRPVQKKRWWQRRR